MRYSRLAVAIAFVVIPAYFVAILAIFPAYFRFSIVTPLLADVARYALAPLLFSTPWLLFIYLNRDRLAETLKHMSETSGVIPMRWRVFYGFNTLIVLSLFVLPFFSPVLAVLGGFVLVGRVYYSRESIRSKSTRARALILVLLFLVFALLPIIILFEFWISYSTLFSDLAAAWSNNIDTIYAFTICLGNALALGSLLWFIYAGAAEFEFQRIGTYMTKAPAKLIRLFESIVFLVFVYLAFPPITVSGVVVPLGGDVSHSILFGIVNPICLAIVGIIFLVSTIKGLRRTGERSSAWGLIFLVGFFSVELLSHMTTKTASVLTVPVLGAAALFAVMFFMSFRKVGSAR